MDNKEPHLTNGGFSDHSSTELNSSMNRLKGTGENRERIKKKSVSLCQPVYEVETIPENDEPANGISNCNGQQDVVQIASILVKEVIERAEADVSKSRKANEKQATPKDIFDDPKVLEMVREFITQVLARAKEEAFATLQCRQSRAAISASHIETTFTIKEEPIADRWMSGLKRKHWYARASKFFANAFGRVCPCKTTILHRFS